MALATNKVKLMELTDVKIAPIKSDGSYGTLVDLAGALKLQIAPKTETKKLYGDSQLNDLYQKTTEIEVSGECTFLSLDALKIIVGGNITTSGTTPNQKAVYSLTAANSTPGYFYLEGQWTYAGDGIGDAHVILYKVKVTDPPDIEINDASGNFGTVKFKAVALPNDSGEWFDIVLNETKTGITQPT